MDNSTDNVTVFAVFLNDVLRNYEDEKEDYHDLFSIVKGYDLTNSTNPIPIAVYNAMTAWIEQHLGKFNLIRVGRNVGATAYEQMLEQGLVNKKSSPLDIVQAIMKLCEVVIQDEKKRSYEVLDTTNNSILLRRTQTFNGKLQLGLLDGIIAKSGVLGLRVDFAEEVDKGAEYDVYNITWL